MPKMAHDKIIAHHTRHNASNAEWIIAIPAKVKSTVANALFLELALDVSYLDSIQPDSLLCCNKERLASSFLSGLLVEVHHNRDEQIHPVGCGLAQAIQSAH